MKESEIVLYTTSNGDVKIDIRFEYETFWLPQQKIADLFGVDRTVVTKHLGNIYSEGELDRTATSAKFAQVRTEFTRSRRFIGVPHEIFSISL